MRLRQVALVARQLAPVVDDLAAVLGLEVAFRDPGVGEFGLENAIFAIGDTFLEVVSPTRPDATGARFLDRRGGDGGYMAIFQTVGLDAHRGRLARLGVRVIWEIAFDDIATIHLHPRDVGGAIVSLDEARPPESWRWAGPDWQAHVRRERVLAIVGIDVQSDAPVRLAERWARALDRPLASPAAVDRGGDDRGDGEQTINVAAGDARAIALEGGRIRFVRAADGRGDGIAAVRLAVADPEAVRSAAQARACVDAAGHVAIGGTRFHLAARA